MSATLQHVLKKSEFNNKGLFVKKFTSITFNTEEALTLELHPEF